MSTIPFNLSMLKRAYTKNAPIFRVKTRLAGNEQRHNTNKRNEQAHNANKRSEQALNANKRSEQTDT